MAEHRLVRDPRQFVLRLVLAEVLSRPGEEGPLAPRFQRLSARGAQALAARRTRSEPSRE